MICAICGKLINSTNKVTVDHVIPRAIYKWSLLDASIGEDLINDIEHPSNKVYAHASCNFEKSDTLLEISLLHLESNQLSDLIKMRDKWKNAISFYIRSKKKLLSKQGYRCYSCKLPITSEPGILRRKYQNKSRDWNTNAIILCSRCNISKKYGSRRSYDHNVKKTIGFENMGDRGI